MNAVNLQSLSSLQIHVQQFSALFNPNEPQRGIVIVEI